MEEQTIDLVDESQPRAFPNFIDGYLQYTEGHESTIRIRKWCAISVIAAALERRIWLNRGYYKLFPNLYTFIIGRSGLVKKSTSTAIAVDILRELDDIRIMAEKMSAISLIEQLSLSGKQVMIGGELVNQSALFAYASELMVFMEEVFGDIVPLLTTFYDCQPNDSSKPWTYTTVKRGKLNIYGPCLNLLGASTKTWLQKCIPNSEIEGGFTSRIIFVVENKLPDKLVPWPDVPIDLISHRYKLIADLQRIHMMNGEIVPTEGAKKKFSEWYEYHMREILPLNQDPRMVGYMSRKGDTILKIAMIHSAAQDAHYETRSSLTSDNIDWAIKEIDDLEMDWRLAFEGSGAPKVLTYDLVDYVRKKGMVIKQNLLKDFTALAPLPQIIRDLKDLKNMGEIEEVKDQEGREYYASPGYAQYALSKRKKSTLY